jgi:hypothetical protein
LYLARRKGLFLGLLWEPEAEDLGESQKEVQNQDQSRPFEASPGLEGEAGPEGETFGPAGAFEPDSGAGIAGRRRALEAGRPVCFNRIVF